MLSAQDKQLLKACGIDPDQSTPAPSLERLEINQLRACYHQAERDWKRVCAERNQALGWMQLYRLGFALASMLFVLSVLSRL